MIRKILVLLVFVGVAAAFWASNTYQAYLVTPFELPEDGLVYQVEPGSSLKGIARDLQDQGVLQKPEYLYWHARYTKQAHLIKSGEYLLKPGLTPDTLLALFKSGQSIQYKVTFVEGVTFNQVRQILSEQETLTHTIQELTDAEIMAKLGRADQHPEGLFFPDTYQFQRGTSDLDILRWAMQKMDKVLALAWQEKQKNIPLKSAYEALILASIVEKETGVGHERPAIAGVFTRRLNKKMKLQTDPTIIYGMGDRYNGNIRRKDIREATPYNTYVIKALPPTPICMPGEAAIKAAVNPADGKALYFVAKGDGSHKFSATLEEHNAAVRKYQLKRK